MKLYESIGQLLADYSQYYKKTISQISDLIGVENRTYQNWLHNKTTIADSNIKDLAEKTHIPFEVLFRLNHDYPTLYNIRNRRYALCPFNSDFANRKILQKELFDTKEQGEIFFLKNEKDINDVCYFFDESSSFKKNDRIPYELAKYLSNVFPDLNLILKDPVGFYSGHIICYPLCLDTYHDLRSKKIHEKDIRIKDICVPPWDKPVALHFYSVFANCSTYVYCLIKRIVHYLLVNVPHSLSKESIISRYVTTADSAELCKKMGMNIVFYGYEDYQEYKIEVLPHFFESRLENLNWIWDYKDKTV